MKKKVTKRQRELLAIIYRYTKNSGYPPTFEEMRGSLGVASNQSVVDLLSKLEKRELIKKTKSSARGLVILPLGYETLGKPPRAPFLGGTAAGLPIEPIELSGEWQTVSPEISKFTEDVFLLKITGDSMINAGIDDGDVVLIKNEKEFISGDVVLADIDGESTIKRFISDDKPPYIYLKPENPKHKIIPATDQMKLVGKVISVLKNGYWKKLD